MAESFKDVELGEIGGVTIVAVAAGYEVKFKFDRHEDNAAHQGPGQDEIKSLTYDPQLVKMMRTVEGADFDNASGAWMVPKASQESLAVMATRLRAEIKAIAVDRDNIFDLAGMTAETKQRDHKSNSTAIPQVSDFLAAGESHNGEIINSNGRFVAQFKSFGAKDGAAFVTVHRTAALDRSAFGNKNLEKGDIVGIKYNEKMVGVVTNRSHIKTMEQMQSEFDAAIGKQHLGVTVTVADKFSVAFDFNPVMKARLQRIADVDFDKETKTFSVPLDAKEFIVRAVADMRNEFVADGKEIAAMKVYAESKIDGANVVRARVEEGFAHSGFVRDVGERYVLQSGGMNKFNLHHRASLDNKNPEIGSDVTIKYKGGFGAVVDKQKEQDKGQER